MVASANGFRVRDQKARYSRGLRTDTIAVLFKQDETGRPVPTAPLLIRLLSSKPYFVGLICAPLLCPTALAVPLDRSFRSLR